MCKDLSIQGCNKCLLVDSCSKQRVALDDGYLEDCEDFEEDTLKPKNKEEQELAKILCGRSDCDCSSPYCTFKYKAHQVVQAGWHKVEE